MDAFRNRLHKNRRHWGRWARRRGIGCYRLYDRDIPEYPLAIDYYQGHLHVQEYARKGLEAMADEQRQRLVEVILEVLEVPTDRLAFKTRQRQRGHDQYRKTGRQGPRLQVQEAGLTFEVELHGYLDTGLFLDHRQTRALVRDRARGRRVLNLFAYTGSFSVYAAAGGALASSSVDLSNTYLAWARRNLQLNGLEASRHELIQSDVFDYLDQARRERRRFGLILLDPPSFSNSKRMQATLDVQRDHPRLIEACLELLGPGGELFFSTNRRRFRLDPALLQHPGCQEITRQTLPDDFRRHTAHRCWHFH